MDYSERTYRAILDEFVPEWRQIIEPNGTIFVMRWQGSTGQNKSSAYRWLERARSLQDQQHLADAA